MSDDLSGFSMMDLFRAEAEGQTAVLSSGLLSLEDAEATAGTIEPMMRAAHSLKGAAKIVGLDSAVRVAHAMEDVLVAAQKGALRLRSPHVDVLLQGVDFLGRISLVPEADAAAWQASHEEDVQYLTISLAAILTGDQADEEEPPDERPIEPPPLPPAAEVPPAEPAPTPEPSPEPTPARPAAPAGDEADRVVRVTAESLTRLLALAGESLVQARQLRPFVDSLLALRSEQSSLWESLQRIEDHLNHGDSPRTGLLDLVTR